MKSITILGNLAESDDFGPDPVILRKRGMPVKSENLKIIKRNWRILVILILRSIKLLWKFLTFLQNKLLA
ncbi:hypothetical protein LEP1GSC100_3320 [Leptospira interrogans serovar Bataviae str. UI 08561]|nr:hypothetical protein LEP1GSC100_3320 [Leptospira interrogans serovar Bataviae str. UI 08561]